MINEVTLMQNNNLQDKNLAFKAGRFTCKQMSDLGGVIQRNENLRLTAVEVTGAVGFFASLPLIFGNLIRVGVELIKLLPQHTLNPESPEFSNLLKYSVYFLLGLGLMAFAKKNINKSYKMNKELLKKYNIT